MTQPSRPLSAPTPEDFAASRLISYAAYQWPGYRDAPHHRLIARKLEAVERGEISRLMISMPPRHGKSMLASEFFPAWYMGRNPDHYVVTATYAQELADDFGRKVKNQIEDPIFGQIFPGVRLADDSKSAKRFHVEQAGVAVEGGIEHRLNQSGACYAVGVGGPLTGRGAHLLLIDDPVKNREDADSEVIRKKTKDWYTSTAYTRLMPGGRVVVIQCLAGDTLVTMADGSRREIRSVRAGDRVISWDGRRFRPASVSAASCNGYDKTYLIRTSETEVRANARHPFLALTEGGLRWIRAKDLTSGMRIARLRRGSIKGSCASSPAAVCRQDVAACATLTMVRLSGLRGIVRHLSRLSVDCLFAASGVMASISANLTVYLTNKAAFARSARQMEALASRVIGSRTSSPIITTRRGRFADYSVTTAIESRVELEIPPFWNEPLNTSGLDTDVVVSVTPYAVELVYDITVEETHNFIANGLVSHNTRWHEDDLAGWLIAEHEHEGWDILSLPAISPAGEALWPDQYPIEALERIRRTLPPRDWSALYQQSPSPEEGDYFKSEWIVPVESLPPLNSLRVYGGSDYAVTSQGGDYTVHAVVGLDPDENLYLLDLWRGQAASDEWVEAWCDLVLKWRPLEWAEETGQIKSGVGPFLDKRARERRAYCVRTQFPTRGDKAIRAQSIRGRMAMRGLRVLAHSAWRSDLVSELLRFPAGVHDDQVDALGLCGQLLDKMLGGNALRPSGPPKKRDRYSRESADTESWKIV